MIIQKNYNNYKLGSILFCRIKKKTIYAIQNNMCNRILRKGNTSTRYIRIYIVVYCVLDLEI